MAELHVTTTPPTVADVNLTFGDGVGFDTMQKTFGHLEGYVVGIDGVDYVLDHVEQLDDDWAFVVRPYPPANGARVASPVTIKMGDMTSLHIF
jgi:hypothetical protein